ncbi:MAG: VOC family protein [Ornithinimicrobium sp.]|uniref:VOC family protein n=1 Tax=Ornithinimicrobium sp. TaxID=1977084 RepID=UPI003D9BD4F9
MRIDHVCYAAGPEGSQACARRLGERLGVPVHAGGVHPTFGTRNMVLPLADQRYLEVVEVLDHPASDKAPFGQAVRRTSERGGGWMAWVVAVDDLADIETRLGRSSVAGRRHTPEGVELSWRQLGVKSLLEDPQLPFFVRWDSTEHHPSTLADTDVSLSSLRIAGDSARIREFLALDEEPGEWERDVDFAFVDREPALESVTFATADGPVTL